MRGPVVMIETATSKNRLTRPIRRRLSSQRIMEPVIVVVRFKFLPLALEILGTPEQHVTPIFPPDCTDRSLYDMNRCDIGTYAIALVFSMSRTRKFAGHR